MTKPDTITIDEVKYVRADSVQAPKPNGKRAVVVLDRGWIFAGDVTKKDGRIQLARAVHVIRWEAVGFDGMIAKPNSDKVTIKPISDVDVPDAAELFSIPVPDSWGLK